MNQGVATRPGRTRSSLLRRAVLGCVVALAATLVVLLFGQQPASAVASQTEFEHCLLDRINEARADHGVAPVEMAYDRIPQVRDWSEWMRFNEFRHMTNAERNPILPSTWWTWAENIAMYGSQHIGCTVIHNMFMNSPGHRDNILNANQEYVALGAYVDGSGWWVTQLFFSAHGYVPDCDGAFCDDDASPFESDIDTIAAEGVTNGCNAIGTRFCPSDGVTRAEMASFIVRLLGLTDRGSVDFTDDDGSVHEADIERLATAGITLGCDTQGPRFCPDRIVPREQMAAFLARALGLTDRGSIDFIDDDSSQFEADIERVATAGISMGCDATGPRFCPASPVTREQMAGFLARSLTLLG